MNMRKKGGSAGTEQGVPAPRWLARQAAGKGMSKRKKILLFSILGVLCAFLIVGGVYAYNILYQPKNLFEDVASQVEKPTPQPSKAAVVKEEEEEELSDYEKLLAQADTSMMKDIVNVALIGVDYAPERETWSGKHDYHADVMMVLAINFKEGRVDMISLPRDTYAKIPGVEGKYKLNLSIDCGGGWPDGLPKVCEAAEWMLGGIPVDYYYAVTMPVVKEIVDAIGGVDFDVDLNFTMAGRPYKKGMQHMDGQAVLDYMRVRKHVAQAGDLNRINRQKKMLIALFNTMKEKDMVTKLPELLAAFEGKASSNLSTEQVAALGVFAYGLNSENIGMHSMAGATKNIYNWNFVLTDQTKRVQLIKQIYGVDVKKYEKYSYSYCMWEWQDMTAEVYLGQAGKLVKFAESALRKDGSLVPPTPTPSPTPAATAKPKPTKTKKPAKPTPSSPNQTESPVASPSKKPSATPTVPGSGAPSSGQKYKYGDKERELLAKVKVGIKTLQKAKKAKKWETMESANAQLKKDCNTLAGLVGYTKLMWKVTYKNEIAVDFR